MKNIKYNPYPTAVYPPYWCIKVGSNTFVGLDQDVLHEKAIKFPSRVSASIFRNDSYGVNSSLTIKEFVHDGTEYKMQP